MTILGEYQGSTYSIFLHVSILYASLAPGSSRRFHNLPFGHPCIEKPEVASKTMLVTALISSIPDKSTLILALFAKQLVTLLKASLTEI